VVCLCVLCTAIDVSSLHSHGKGDNENPDQNRRLSLGHIPSKDRQGNPLPAKPMPSRVLDRRWHSDALVEVFRDRLIRKP